MCIICKNESKMVVFQKMSFLKCENCGFLAKSKDLILSEELEEQRYLLHDNDDTQEYYDYQFKFFEVIRPYLGNVNLDYGCGKAKMLSNVLKDNGLVCFNYDKYFLKSDYQSLSYDSIILEEVIEHIENPINVLTGLKNLLNENGKLIIRTRLIDNQNLDNFWYLRDTTHISFFTKKSFEEIGNILDMKIIFTNDYDLVILER